MIPFIGRTREETLTGNAEARFWCCWQLHCQHGISCWVANICKQLGVIPTLPYTGDQVARVLCASTDWGTQYTPHTSVFPESRRTGEAPELARCDVQ